jgi:hypothetical protein
MTSAVMARRTLPIMAKVVLIWSVCDRVGQFGAVPVKVAKSIRLAENAKRPIRLWIDR